MMTTLQIVLAIVGVSLIAIIVIYNVLQERKFRKEAERMFATKRDDVMLGEAVRQEGGTRKTESQIELGDTPAEPAPEARATAKPTDRAQVASALLSSLEPLPPRTPEPELVSAPEPVPQPQPVPQPKAQAQAKTVEARLRAEPPAQFVPPPTPEPVAPRSEPARTAVHPPVAESVAAGAEDWVPRQASALDLATEYIARLKFAKPQLGNFAALLSVLRRLGKPVRGFGLKADGAWEPLSGHPRNVYGQVEFGLQLADRGGALTPDQLDAFCRALYEFAAEEGGAVSCPDKDTALELAQELDLFCMEVDVLIGLNVSSAESRPFTSEAMHSLAQEARLNLEGDGQFHARDDFGHSLFTLANQEDEPFPRDGRGLTTHGVTLLFDVPRVADGLNVFDRMTRLGFDLAFRLEGRLVDDSGRPVSEDSLTRDRARLAHYFARMEERGIPAGGERALRLFV